MIWWDKSWNPIIGCTPCSPACENCYAERLHTQRHEALRRGSPMPMCYAEPFGKVRFLSERLTQPLHWRKPQRVFVGNMCDLFHPDVTDDQLDAIFVHMALCKRHTFMLLTKRPERAREYLSQSGFLGRLVSWGHRRWGLEGSLVVSGELQGRMMLRNVWLGATIWDQPSADERIPILLNTPAAKRFVSVEPMLGPVDLSPWFPGSYECAASCGHREGADSHHEVRCVLCGFQGADTYEVWGDGDTEVCPECGAAETESVCPECGTYMVREHPDTQYLDWVICGGETGPGARPMHPDWPRSLRDQCQAAGVPFFFKQWGEWGTAHVDIRTGKPSWWAFDNYQHYCCKAPTHMSKGDKLICPDGHIPTDGREEGKTYPMVPVKRLGARRTGRELDGRTWEEVPIA